MKFHTKMYILYTAFGVFRFSRDHSNAKISHFWTPSALCNTFFVGKKEYFIWDVTKCLTPPPPLNRYVIFEWIRSRKHYQPKAFNPVLIEQWFNSFRWISIFNIFSRVFWLSWHLLDHYNNTMIRYRSYLWKNGNYELGFDISSLLSIDFSMQCL